MFITFLFPFLSHTEVSYGGTQFHIFKIQMLIIKFGIHYNVDGGKMLIFSIFLCSQNLKNRFFLIKFFSFCFCSYGNRINWKVIAKLGIGKLYKLIQTKWARAKIVDVIVWHGIERSTERTQFTSWKPLTDYQKDTGNKSWR